MIRRLTALGLTAVLLASVTGCDADASPSGPQPPEQPSDRWAIYELDLDTSQTGLVYSTTFPIEKCRVNPAGDTIAFSEAGTTEPGVYNTNEIYTIRVGEQDRSMLTSNGTWDLYPAWSPDGSEVAFLSLRGDDLDIYIMNSDGSDQRLLFDSGSHDADIDWEGDLIAFTSGSRIWLMNSDGSGARPITDPPRAGEWGDAVLPFGDYDPRISPDGEKVVFSRLVDDESQHGNYDLFLVDVDGTGLTRLTETGYTQGVADWSNDGENLIYILAAVGEEGRYDAYMMNADGTDNHNITPAEYPANLLIHWAVFSPDDAKVYFVGEWW